MAWSKSTRISIMLAIDIIFFLVELLSGFLVGSLALTADAFHMLNDIISLLVGLWAVTAAKRSTTDKFSYGWLRAEILGAFFNSVFLIALCVSIILDATQRFFEPPAISNPQLILIVGCTGLSSNLLGFIVLGGHGHSHGSGDPFHAGSHEHSYEDDYTYRHIHAAEEGQAASGRNHCSGNHGLATDASSPAALFETGSVGYNNMSESDEHIQSRTEPKPEKGTARESSKTLRRERLGTDHSQSAQLQSIEDLEIYPASLRQHIIDRSPAIVYPSERSSADDASTIDGNRPNENTPLTFGTDVSNGLLGTYGLTDDGKPQRSPSFRSRSRDYPEAYMGQNHTKPRKLGKQAHKHNHGDMGMDAMVLHVIGDALGNIGVISTALILWLTNWPGKVYVDPAVSLFITIVILRSALPLTTATSKVLLQAAPDQIDIQDVKEDIQGLPDVVSCHHVHVWQLSDTKTVASMHIRVAFPIAEEGGSRYMALAKHVQKCLHAYGIHSATIQPQFSLSRDRYSFQDHVAVDGETEGCVRAMNTKGDGTVCLLDCVDDCIGQGCCDNSTTPCG